MFSILKSRSGLTLIELLIVVIILGVLAAVAIPQFSSSTDDARLATLDTSLSELRNSIELYYHQHNQSYPGSKKHTDGTAVSTTAEADSAFINQLTLYSNIDGVTSTSKTATHKYGPYVKKGIPKNPFNDFSSIKTDVTTSTIGSVTTDGTTGWKFYVQTGRFVANDGKHDSN